MASYSRQFSTDDDRTFSHVSVPGEGGVFVLRGDTTVRIPPCCVYDGEKATLSIASGRLHKSRIPFGAILSDVVTVKCTTELWRPIYLTFSHMSDTSAPSRLLLSLDPDLEQNSWKPASEVKQQNESVMELNYLLTHDTVIVELKQFSCVSCVLLGEGEQRKYNLSIYADYVTPEPEACQRYPRLALTTLFNDTLLKKLHDHAHTLDAGKHIGDMTLSLATDKQVDISLSIKQAPLLWGNDVTIKFDESYSVDELGRRGVPMRKCLLPWEDMKVARLGVNIRVFQAGTELGQVDIKDVYLRDAEDEKFYREPIDLYGRVHERLRVAPQEMMQLAEAFQVVAEPEVSGKDTGLITALFLSAMFTTNDIERVLRKFSKSFHSWLMSVLYQG